MCLWHYTSLESLRGILNTKHLNFWGTRYDSMNDPREFIYARDKAREFFANELPQRKDIQDADKDELEIYPYVVSFSRKKDDFLMWRLYKGEIALVLNENELTSCSDDYYLVGDCNYLTEDELMLEFKKLLDNNDTNDFMRKAQELYPFYKSPDFWIESEYRMVKYNNSFIRVSASQDSGDITHVENENADDIKFKFVKDNDIILYKEFHVCKSALEKIVVHNYDKNSFEKVKSHIEVWLNANGYKDVDVEQTQSTPVK